AVVQRELGFEQASRDHTGQLVASCVEDFYDRVERRPETLRLDLEREALPFARFETIEIFDREIGGLGDGARRLSHLPVSPSPRLPISLSLRLPVPDSAVDRDRDVDLLRSIQRAARRIFHHFRVASGGELDSVRGAVRRVEFEPRRRIPAGDIRRIHSCATSPEVEACNFDVSYCSLPDAEWEGASDEWGFTNV